MLRLSKINFKLKEVLILKSKTLHSNDPDKIVGAKYVSLNLYFEWILILKRK